MEKNKEEDQSENYPTIFLSQIQLLHYGAG